jgi:hypothetical protein
MKIRSHFKHNVFMLDEVGNLLEHLGGTEDYLLAAELYEVCLKRWPTARAFAWEASVAFPVRTSFHRLSRGVTPVASWCSMVQRCDSETSASRFARDV